MNTVLKGEIAELEVQRRAAEKGFVVSHPTTPARYDLIIDDGKSLKKVQVKYCGHAPGGTGARRVMLEKKSQSKSAVMRTYSDAEIDAVLAYLPESKTVLWFDIEKFKGRPSFQVRIEPAKNGQKEGIIWWEDFVW